MALTDEGSNMYMDDLMTAVKTQNPRLYDSIMRQL